MPQRASVFVSYSHCDAGWLERLQVHLKPLGRRGDFELWDDTKIAAGDHWRLAIREAIDRAAASVLLISADFLASDFVTSEELPPLLSRAQTAGAKILPIIVQPCRLASHPELTQFQSLNPPDRPLSKLSRPEAEEVFMQAAEQIDRVIRESIARPQAVAGCVDAEQLFAQLQAALLTVSALAHLAQPANASGEYTLTEIQDALRGTSRKATRTALETLACSGWVEKTRSGDRTRYRIAADGIRQLRRLTAVREAPLE